MQTDVRTAPLQAAMSSLKVCACTVSVLCESTAASRQSVSATAGSAVLFANNQHRFAVEDAPNDEHSGYVGGGRGSRIPGVCRVSRRDLIVSPIGHVQVLRAGRAVFDVTAGVGIIRTRNTSTIQNRLGTAPVAQFRLRKPFELVTLTNGVYGRLLVPPNAFARQTSASNAARYK